MENHQNHSSYLHEHPLNYFLSVTGGINPKNKLERELEERLLHAFKDILVSSWTSKGDLVAGPDTSVIDDVVKTIELLVQRINKKHARCTPMQVAKSKDLLDEGKVIVWISSTNGRHGTFKTITLTPVRGKISRRTNFIHHILSETFREAIR